MWWFIDSAIVLDPIDAFIAQQSEDGQRDSEGAFTVSGERALEKLSSHQLPRTSAWTLKMVQAGVAAGSSGIWVKHGAKSCEIRYMAGEFGTLEDLRTIWFDPAPSLNPAQRHLIVGLRTVAFARQRPVLMVQNCQSYGMRSLFWNGAHLSPIQTEHSSYVGILNKTWANPGETVFFVSGSPLGRDQTVQKLHGVNDVVASEFKELQSNAICCPVPLWVDSRALNHFGLQDVSMTRRSLAFSAQAPPEDSSAPTLRLPEGVQSEHALPAGAKLAWTLYSSDKPGESRVSWVHGGVVCQEESLHIPPSRYQVRLFLPAEDLETDLTALHLRFPEKEEQYRRVAQGALDFCREIEPFSPLVQQLAKGSTGKFYPWLAASCFVLGGVLLAPTSSGFSLLAGFGSLVGYEAYRKSSQKSKANPALEHFRQSILRRYTGHTE